tara:strand:+ start:299 stop:1036 length:738 start_codon:yes stop_codon:yes gene_type:complete
MSKIRFTNSISGILEDFPIVSASKVKRKWMAEPNKKYKEKLTELKANCPFSPQFYTSNHIGTFIKNISRCPGLVNLFHTGYVLVSPFDMRINTNGDGKTINVNIPFSHSQLGFAPVATHSPDVLHQYCPPPHNTNESIIKIDAGWQVGKGRKDVVFLVTNLHYSEERRFTGVTGILDPLESTKVISQLYWHVNEGTEIIKAGTPLTHIIPMKRGFNPEWECTLPNDKDIELQRASYFRSINTFAG